MKPFLPACVLAAFLVLCLSSPPPGSRKRPGSSRSARSVTRSRRKRREGARKIADNVVAVAPGPFPGVWEVDVVRNGKNLSALSRLFPEVFLQRAIHPPVRHGEPHRPAVSGPQPRGRRFHPVRDAIRVGSKTAKKIGDRPVRPDVPLLREAARGDQKAVAKDPDVAFLVMPYPRNPKDITTYRKCQAVICSKSEKAARRRLRREGASGARLQNRRGGRYDPAHRAAEDRGYADDDPPGRAHDRRLHGGGGAALAPDRRQVSGPGGGLACGDLASPLGEELLHAGLEPFGDANP